MTAPALRRGDAVAVRGIVQDEDDPDSIVVSVAGKLIAVPASELLPWPGDAAPPAATPVA